MGRHIQPYGDGASFPFPSQQKVLHKIQIGIGAVRNLTDPPHHPACGSAPAVEIVEVGLQGRIPRTAWSCLSLIRRIWFLAAEVLWASPLHPYRRASLARTSETVHPENHRASPPIPFGPSPHTGSYYGAADSSLRVSTSAFQP